jgi:hypothetical protein
MHCNEHHGRFCREFAVFITAHDTAWIVKSIPRLDAAHFLNPYPRGLDSAFLAFQLMGKDSLLGLDSKDEAMKDCKFLVNTGNAMI